jgi:hypothetical protein
MYSVTVRCRRSGARPAPLTRRSGAGARTVFTAISDRAVGLLGVRRQRRVGGRHGRPWRASGQTGPAVTFGWAEGDGDLPDRAEVTRRLGIDERTGEATGSTGRLRAAGGQRSGGEEPKELGPPQLDSAKPVPIGTRTEGSGNRVSVERCRRIRGRAAGIESETRHRPPRHSARRAM